VTIHRGIPKRLERSTTRLLREVPDFILSSYPITQWGLSEGLALAASHWRALIAAGEIPHPEMRASIVPVAALTSAMLEAFLRGVTIDQRAAAFEMLADDSARCLTGRPHAVIIQSGIL
jgi:hypothetical protein